MSVIGALRVVMGIDTATYESRLRRAASTTRTQTSAIVTSFNQMKAAVTGAIRFLTGSVIAGFLIQQGRAALDFAASLSETARSIGVTVEQLQILRRGAIENGASIEGMVRAVGILNRTLGQARAGVPAAVQAFRALRLDPEQFTNAGEAIPRVMEAIRGLRTQSEQAAAAQRLFGRGAQELIPLLIQGAEGYEDLARRAREAGLITQEQADRADEAADKIALLGEALRINLASALVNVLPLIMDVAGAIGGLISQASSAFNWLSRITNFGGQSGGRSYAGVVARGFVPIIGPWLAGQYLADARSGEGTPGTLGSVLGRVGAPTATGDHDLDLSSRGRGGGGGADRAERERKERLRNDHEFERERRRTQMELLRERQQQTDDEIVRGDLSREILALERAQFVSDQRLAVALEDTTKARAAILLQDYDQLDAEKRATLDIERYAADMSERQELADAAFELQREQLQQEADMAETARERRAAELRILDLTYRHERAKLEAVIANEQSSHAEVLQARNRLGQLDGWRDRAAQEVIRNTQGPLEQFLAQLPHTAAQANEALQGIAANGLQALTDGLIEAILQTKNLGQVFKRVALSILSDLLRLQIQRSIIGPLANALGGMLGGIGGGASFLPGGTGGWQGGTGGFSGIGGLGLPGFATGGSIRIGGMAGVDRNLLSLNHQPIARVGMGERIDISNGRTNGGPAGDVHVHQHFSFEGVAITQEEFVRGLMATKQATVAAIQGARRRAA